MSDTATLTVNGKSLDLALTIGSEGEIGMDISQLRSKTGAVTLDYGYAKAQISHQFPNSKNDQRHSNNTEVLWR